MTDIVSGCERRKVAFLAEYEALCRRYGMMVVQISRSDYSPLCVADISDDMRALDKADEEMRIEPLRLVTW